MAGDPVPLDGAGAVGKAGATEGVQPGDNGAGVAYGAPGVMAGGAGKPGTIGALGGTVVGAVVKGAPDVAGAPRPGQAGDVTGTAG